MRVLFSSTPGAGHVQPMLPVALALRDAGHEVRWATGPDAVGGVEQAGVPAVATSLAWPAALELHRRRHPDAEALRGDERAAFFFPTLFGGVAAPAALDGLLDEARRWRPDLIVHEQAELAAPAVARDLGVPNVCHGFGLVVPAERVARAAEEASAIWGRVGVAGPPPFGGCYEHLYVDVSPPSLQPEPLPHLGRRALRRPRSLDAAPGAVLPPDVEAVLRRGRPVVYLTFGTIFNVNPTFGRALRAVASLDVEVVATVGPSGDPDAFGPRPANVTMARYVPQSLLLPHVDLVVSHAGSGTLLAALALGLPQLCLPQAADQFRNADACDAAGAALALRGPEVTEEEVAAASARLLQDPAFADRAGGLAREIAAMPPPEDLVPLLADLAGAA